MSSDPKAIIAAKFLDSLLKELVLETALTTHASAKRARAICSLCGTRCRMHTPAAGHNPQSSSTQLEDGSGASSSASGTPHPPGAATNKLDYYSNNPLFECLVCSRQVSSNRYATHLAKCMGMSSKGGRKGASRTAKASANNNSISNRFGTPKYSSDLDDDAFVKKAKTKTSTQANSDKRGLSPFSATSVASARMSKKIKTSSPTPPPPDSLTGSMARSHSSQPFAPSGLSNSTVLNGSPLNPLNSKRINRAGSESALHEDDSKIQDSTSNKPRGRPSTSLTRSSNGNGIKRKREQHDDTDEEDGEGSFKDLGSNGSASDPASDVEFDEPDGDEEGEISEEDVALAVDATNANSRGPRHNMSEDEDNEDDEDADDDDEEVNSVHLTGTRRHSSPEMALGNSYGNVNRQRKTSNSGGLQRERGSDGEFIDVESASEQSDNDSF